MLKFLDFFFLNKRELLNFQEYSICQKWKFQNKLIIQQTCVKAAQVLPYIKGSFWKDKQTSCILFCVLKKLFGGQTTLHGFCFYYINVNPYS
jgi:hypothetical protein